MGHGKLRKFAENETFRCLLQPAASEVMSHGGNGELLLRDHPVEGRWNRDMFAADQPVVLELGCGKGEYTIALAERHPEMNFIGVDIKGARLWKGAKYATEKALPNVAFLRTRIEFIPAFFAPGEVSEIWLTFSDPQLKSPNCRLTSPLFLERYRRFLAPDGIIHLKTDSRFLHEYTMAVARANALPVLASGTDIYREGVTVTLPDGTSSSYPPCREGLADTGTPGEGLLPGERVSSPEPMATLGHVRGMGPSEMGGVAKRRFGEDPFLPEGNESPALRDLAAVFEVQTFYESMFLEMGLPITYMAFTLDRPATDPATGPIPAPGPTSVPASVPDPVPALASSPAPDLAPAPAVAAPAFVAPADFDEQYWREAEGPRRTFSHQRPKSPGR